MESKYGTIIVDPPWPYRQKLDRGTVRGGVKYPTMSVEQIKEFHVETLAAPDCQCWLWTTNSHLHDALHVLEAWGFRYITMCTWVKTKMGLGYWLRGKTEHCLLGVRGTPRDNFIGPHGSSGYDHSTVIYAAPQGHSRKPDDFERMIDDIGQPLVLELFATRTHDGWDSVGFDLGTDVVEFIKERRLV